MALPETRQYPEPSAAGDLARHVEDSVETLAELHRAHYRTASGFQKAVDGITGILGRPWFLLVVALAILLWGGGTLANGGGVEQASFAWLELVTTISALLIALLILVTQRRADALTERREQFTLQLALLNDKKSAKIICLMEELRRDQPQVADRVDEESAEMSQAVDADQVLAAIEERAGEENARS